MKNISMVLLKWELSLGRIKFYKKKINSFLTIVSYVLNSESIKLYLETVEKSSRWKWEFDCLLYSDYL